MQRFANVVLAFLVKIQDSAQMNLIDHWEMPKISIALLTFELQSFHCHIFSHTTVFL